MFDKRKTQESFAVKVNTIMDKSIQAWPKDLIRYLNECSEEVRGTQLRRLIANWLKGKDSGCR